MAYKERYDLDGDDVIGFGDLMITSKEESVYESNA